MLSIYPKLCQKARLKLNYPGQTCAKPVKRKRGQTFRALAVMYTICHGQSALYCGGGINNTTEQKGGQ
jgi:hypothetical protein